MAKVTTVKTTKLPVVLCLVIFKKFLEIYAKKKNWKFFWFDCSLPNIMFPSNICSNIFYYNNNMYQKIVTPKGVEAYDKRGKQ